MAPLRGFVYAMSLSWPFATGREDFGVLHVVVNARSQSPTDVISSLKLVKDAVPATKGLLTGFQTYSTRKTTCCNGR